MFVSGHTKDYVCTKNFSLAKLPNTNLVLITTDRKSTACNKKDWKLTREPVKHILFCIHVLSLFLVIGEAFQFCIFSLYSQNSTFYWGGFINLSKAQNSWSLIV